MGKRTVTAGLFICAAVAACNLGTSEDGASTSEAANTAARAPLLAPTWAKCWIEKDVAQADPALQRHEVKCRYDAPDAKQPVKPQSVLVDVHFGGSNRIETLDRRSGEEVSVAKIAGNQFPIEINFIAYGESFREVGLSETWFSLNAKVEDADKLPSDRPFEAKQPFDLWPVIVINKALISYVQLEERTFSVAPFKVGEDATSSDAHARGKILGRSAEPAPIVTYFVAPKEGELKGTYKAASAAVGQMIDIPAGARIPGPGVYVATESEFRKATDEEASIVGPAPLPPSSTDASAPAVDGGSSEIDAAPEASGPPRECGVDGKKCCGGTNGGYGGTCDPGAFCPSGNNVCVACGGENQKCCGGPNNNGYGGTCNTGSFCPSGNNVCVACGDPNEKCCGGPNNNGYGGTCNPGSFCFSGNNVCASCGKPGEKCCGGPNGNGYGGTCDTGATCKSGNNVCVANP